MSTAPADLPSHEDARQALEALQRDLRRLVDEIQRVIVGQDEVIRGVVTCLVAGGHGLLEGVPGLGKTLLVRTLAAALDLAFARIQFTPDLMPADILGTDIIVEGDGGRRFEFQPGPLFANVVLADEINRATPKTQSALLEAMQERQVTIGRQTFPLEEPFLVLATQNPIEQEGTYPLPEAQTDRFMLKVKITYPSMEEEREIIRRNLGQSDFGKVEPVVSPAQILKARESVRKVYMDEKIEQYILDIVFATRQPERYGLAELRPLIGYGASPRASINLALAAKAYAFLQRRGFVIPEDIRHVCMDVLRHRIGLTYEAEAEDITQEDIVTRILNTVEVP